MCCSLYIAFIFSLLIKTFFIVLSCLMLKNISSCNHARKINKYIAYWIITYLNIYISVISKTHVHISDGNYTLNIIFSPLPTKGTVSYVSLTAVWVCCWCFYSPVATLHHKMRWDPQKTQTTATVAQIAVVGQLWSGPLMSQVTEFKFAPCYQATVTDFFPSDTPLLNYELMCNM